MRRLSQALSIEQGPGSASPRVHPAGDDGVAAGGEAAAPAGNIDAATPRPGSPSGASVRSHAVMVDAHGTSPTAPPMQQSARQLSSEPLRDRFTSPVTVAVSAGSTAAAAAAAAPGGGDSGTIPAMVKKRISFAAPITAGPAGSPPKVPLVAASGASATQQHVQPSGGSAASLRAAGARKSFLGEAAGDGAVRCSQGKKGLPAPHHCCLLSLASSAAAALMPGIGGDLGGGGQDQGGQDPDRSASGALPAAGSSTRPCALIVPARALSARRSHRPARPAGSCSCTLHPCPHTPQCLTSCSATGRLRRRAGARRCCASCSRGACC